MIIRMPGQRSFNFGLGFHSRLEPLSVYHYKVKVSATKRDERNQHLKSAKAFHFTTGFTCNFSNNLQFSWEAYYQFLWAIPIKDGNTGQFSIINSVGGLSDVIMANNGKARNILRRKYSYSNKQIITLDSKGIGMVPVLTVRAEF
ncbi:MAG: hypothetical protein C0397_11445 [Odoribacter sp.]|nr:hypothetical protein [Odoribacter sp.]